MVDTQSSRQPPTELQKGSLSVHGSRTPRPDTKKPSSISSLSTLSLPAHSLLEDQSTIRSPRYETLALGDCDFDERSFSELLKGGMAVNSRVALPPQTDSGVSGNAPASETGPVLQRNVGYEGKFVMSHQDVLAVMTANAAPDLAQAEYQSGCAGPPIESSSAIQSESSVLDSTLVTQEELSTPNENIYVREVNQQTTGSASSTLANDGYNWRKYGQKQVKSARSSRSYYRCANSGCHAKKKIQRCDHSGCVIEIVNEGQHNHEPPPNIKCTRSRTLVASYGHVVGNDITNHHLQGKYDSDQYLLRRENGSASLQVPEKEAQTSSNSDGSGSNKADDGDGDDLEQKERSDFQQPILQPLEGRKQHNGGSSRISSIEAQRKPGDESRSKRRLEERALEFSGTVYKTFKEPKIVVHASGDVSTSSDGYRWRKYGQKMVKGNPHPRSYYRCTSAGCPVRKQIERDSDDAKAVIVSYKGKHDHDMPVPKKQHGLVIAAPKTVNSVQSKNTGKSLPKEKFSNRWWEEMEGDLDPTGEKVMELGGEKALESARTLLSMGIEIRPC